MKRIATANRAVDLFGQGKDGFRPGVPGLSDPTSLSADFMNGVQESIVRVIERAGLAPSDDPEQLANAIGADALQLSDYAALRTYTGPRKGVYVTGVLATAAPSGISGMFVRDDSDTVSTDNGGTVIVGVNGKRWKRCFDGMMNAHWFGADPSYTTNSSPAFQAAILAGGWNGTSIYVPNGTYRDEDGIVIGTVNGTQNCFSVTLIGESTHGTVIMRPPGKSAGPILTMSGFHNIPERMTLMSELTADGTNYSASHAIYIRGNPQPGTNGNGTKENAYRNLKIMRVGIGIQIGDYNTDGKDPDIETNLFTGIEISQCNGGVFLNGQNILHNHLLACHLVDCRDFLVKQSRGGDFSAERCYFGGLYDYLTNNYNVPATEKISITGGHVYLGRCRSEDWASSTGNLTPRFALSVNSTDSKVIRLDGNTFTTRDNATTEPCVKLVGQGTGGNAAVAAQLVANYFGGYVSIDTLDVFDLGSHWKGTGNGIVNGRLVSANQLTQVFRDTFFGANQDAEIGSLTMKRQSNTMLKFTRSVPAISSEWQGTWASDDAGLTWGRLNGLRVVNATPGFQTAVITYGARNAGTYREAGFTYGTAAPTNGVWKAGDEVKNSVPAVGSPKAWLCTVAGAASSTTRADAANYTVGIYAKWSTGLTVWECTTAGTTQTGAPDITGKAVGQTVTDGGVTWTLRATTQAVFVSTGNL